MNRQKTDLRFEWKKKAVHSFSVSASLSIKHRQAMADITQITASPQECMIACCRSIENLMGVIEMSPKSEPLAICHGSVN
jgi:hypothetical protein